MTLKSALKEILHRGKSHGQENFFCPICSYHGPFINISPQTGQRKNAQCFRCYSMERHRLQKLVLSEVLKQYNLSELKVLHFAPELFFEEIFQESCQSYLTADLEREDVDVQCDISRLPFNDSEFDLVYASHVLEHVVDDLQALSEIRRVMRPGGIAILLVPIVGDTTVEYQEPNPLETFHVRAPGKDYYDRYQQVFSRIQVFSSEDFPQKYQTYIYEDRTIYPNASFPLRQSMIGEKHIDFVPVCFR